MLEGSNLSGTTLSRIMGEFQLIAAPSVHAPPEPSGELRCRDLAQAIAQLRDTDPQRYWLQGMKPKDLEAAFDEMSAAENGLLAVDAFRALYLERYQSSLAAQRALGLVANALQGFTPETRPVFARVMAVHLRVHYALLRLDAAGGVGVGALGALFKLPASSEVLNMELRTTSLAYITMQLGRKIAPLLADGPSSSASASSASEVQQALTRNS